MHMYLVVAAVLAVTLQAGLGIATLTTGWLAPWARKRVLRPRLWGYGMLAGGIGMGVYLFLGPWGGGPSDGARGTAAWCGWGLSMAGLLVQMFAQRPRRASVTASRSSTPATPAGRTCGPPPAP